MKNKNNKGYKRILIMAEIEQNKINEKLLGQIEEINVSLENVSSLLDRLSDEEEIWSIVNALEVMIIKTSITKICIEELGNEVVNISYAKKIIIDNNQTIQDFNLKLKQVEDRQPNNIAM